MSPRFLPPAILHLLTIIVSISAAPTSLLPGRPFVTVWNAPTSQCWDKYGVDLDLDPFDVVVNQNQSFAGGEMVIFYRSQLGLYPYYGEDGDSINGGLPQNGSLSDHLDLAYKHLVTTIPSTDFHGAAVIDWEEWRPLWDRNWDKKDIYRKRSQDLVRGRHPEWPAQKVLLEARREFEEATEKFITSTLALCRKFRPGGLWGFYGFPSCYNYDYKRSGGNYTGQCPSMEEDLIQTIGQSAALGTTGIEACLAVKSYIDTTLGRYVVNVTTGAALCSRALCTGNGRCVRKDSTSNCHLHLHPDSFIIRRNPGGRGFLVSGEASKMDVSYMAVHFQCRCYPGWEGPDCSHLTG
uniref:Hyaluronidase n=1 Tax=Pyxicephalus adspersus TaxID=30357 RepID=A0AAV3A4A5_PYXAD|nr:TPA: hypothetical protein GDO54_016613 [Pyxicephalus adspersus]